MPISGGDEEGYAELYIFGFSIGLTAIWRRYSSLWKTEENQGCVNEKEAHFVSTQTKVQY